MSEDDCVQLFTRHLAETARSMTLQEATAFLRGALCVTGEVAVMGPVRSIYLNLRDTDRQLELIASGQLRLPIDDLQPEAQG